MPTPDHIKQKILRGILQPLRNACTADMCCPAGAIGPRMSCGTDGSKATYAVGHQFGTPRGKWCNSCSRRASAPNPLLRLGAKARPPLEKGQQASPVAARSYLLVRTTPVQGGCRAPLERVPADVRGAAPVWRVAAMQCFASWLQHAAAAGQTDDRWPLIAHRLGAQGCPETFHCDVQ